MDVRYRFGAFTFDPPTGELRLGERLQRLQPQVAALLGLLLSRPRQLITHDELMEALWPDVLVNDEALTQVVSRLRRALGETRAAPLHLETLPRRGYRLLGDVAREAREPAAPLPVAPVDVSAWAHTTLRGDGPARRFPTLTIAAHPDPGRVGATARATSLSLGERLALSRLEPLFTLGRGDGAAPLADGHLSRSPVTLWREGDRLAIEATELAALRVDGRRVGSVERLDEAALARGVTLELAERVVVVLQDAAEQRPPRDDLGLVGTSFAAGAVRREIVRVVAAGARTIVVGAVDPIAQLEVASAIARALDMPLVDVHDDAAALPAGVATLVRDADALDPDALGELLARPGSRHVLATGMVGAALACHPLARLADAYVIEAAPLRQRRADIAPLLFRAIEAELGVERARLHLAPTNGVAWLPAPLVARLVRHDWPGDRTELAGIARQLAVLGRDAPIEHPPAHLDGLLPRPS